MKQILFRAKRIGRIDGFHYRSQYQNGDWVYGLITKQYPLEWQDKLYDEMTDIYGVSGIEIDRETVGQFTGLCDKNGNEIFEGDIVKVTTGLEGYKSTYHSTIHRVTYDVCNCGVAVFYPFDNSDMVEVEVIGNIYDNHELLEEISK